VSTAPAPFGLHNLPYGVFSRGGSEPRIGTRTGDQILDLTAAERAGLIDTGGSLQSATLNDFMSLGRPQWTLLRQRLVELLTSPAEVADLLVPVAAADLLLPIEVGDYADFYSSREHATNVGHIFRPNATALPPNWTSLPIGYHGRAGTVVASGTPVVRPSGQRRVGGDIEYGPCLRLDFEAEVGFVLGVPSALGEPIPTAEFAERVFGVVLLNDWSARDLQQWESQPLGPFLAKSFATSISPWVVPLDALAAARVRGPVQDPPVHAYLERAESWGLDLALEVAINDTVVSRPRFAGMYWTPDQQLAHLTANGASTRTGDLYASGTVSGPAREQRGCLLELTWNGAEPIELAGGQTREFLADGDTVTISATAPGPDGTVVGFGAVTGRVLPARPGG
jgi:fumarylacetoacetase